MYVWFSGVINYSQNTEDWKTVHTFSSWRTVQSFRGWSTPLTTKFRGFTPCSGQTWKGWMLALVCQRHANCVSLGALRYSFCNVRDFIVVAFNARLASEKSVKYKCFLVARVVYFTVSLNGGISLVEKKTKKKTLSLTSFHQYDVPKFLLQEACFFFFFFWLFF